MKRQPFEPNNKEKDTPLPEFEPANKPINNLIDNNDNDNEEGED